jgi:hypothetical protein
MFDSSVSVCSNSLRVLDGDCWHPNVTRGGAVKLRVWAGLWRHNQSRCLQFVSTSLCVLWCQWSVGVLVAMPIGIGTHLVAALAAALFLGASVPLLFQSHVSGSGSLCLRLNWHLCIMSICPPAA